jgi:hypothetical protein
MSRWDQVALATILPTDIKSSRNYKHTQSKFDQKAKKMIGSYSKI